MSLALQLQPSCWYRTLLCKVGINSMRLDIIAACAIIVVGHFVNLGVVLAATPVAVLG